MTDRLQHSQRVAAARAGFRRLKERLEPPKRALPDDTPVALTELASFDALLEGSARIGDTSTSHAGLQP